MEAEVQFGKADLTNCEREPIHIPGSIQPHGVLIALDQDSLKVVQVSANVKDFLGIALEDLLAISFQDLIKADEFSDFQTKVSSENCTQYNPCILNLKSLSGYQPFIATIHKHNQLVVLELENHQQVNVTVTDLYNFSIHSLSRIIENQNFQELLDSSAKEIRKIIEFDRVMIYHFDQEWNGEVVAEDKRDDLEPFLGLHYPTTDIPRQARNLYEKNLLRMIPDIHYKPVPLVPENNPLSDKPTDLTYSFLRSVSPIHLEYLGNMGVAATLVISIIVKGKLWGLIACHHYSPKYLTYEVRLSAKLITEILASKVSIIESREINSFYLKIKSYQNLLKTIVFTKGDLKSTLKDITKDLNESLKSCGFAIYVDKMLSIFGDTPPREEVERLIDWIQKQPNRNLFHTNHLIKSYPFGEKIKDFCSGLVAVCLDEEGKSFFLCFRPEYIQSVTWGGNPSKQESIAEDGTLKLSPRRSFSLWKETTKCKSLSWTAPEIDSISRLAETIKIILDKQESENALLESEERFRNMANHAPVMIWVSDEAGEINYLNHEWERILGYSPKEDFISDWWKFIHPDDLESYKEKHFNALKTKIGFECEYRFKNSSGEYRWISSIVESRVDKSKKLNGLIACCVDVTDYKNNERSLIEARKTAEAANQAKGEFLANMSHELRTPLNAMLGASQLLLDTETSPEQRELLETVFSSSKSLLELINDILDFAKIEAGKAIAVCESFELNDLVAELQEIFFLKIIEKQLSFQFLIEENVPQELYSDRLKLKQILANLINNAIKFTHSGGITVHISLYNYESVKFSIIDTGIGIPLDKLESIFEKFVQVEASSTRQFEGSGLGLAIVQHLVSLLGGKIQVESTLNKGSNFFFILPLKEPSHSLENTKKNVIPNLKTEDKKDLKVLLADDNQINQKITQKMLEKLSCKVEIVENGIQAVEKAKTSHYDLIFMDCQMPEMDGFEAAQIIKNLQNSLPIVALTANASLNDKEKCLKSGMDDFLAKPIYIEDLGKMINKWVKN
ncbi:MAG: response regulator [Candidatus Caenarcaniphilales bacterium]|nr:response regulator [Candidatus Caenarcaniphilales bacterium]